MNARNKHPWLQQHAVPSLLAIVLAVLGLIFHRPLIDWFSGPNDGADRASESAGGAHDHGAGAPTADDGAGGDHTGHGGVTGAAVSHTFSTAAGEEIRKALVAYDSVRASLAADDVSNLGNLSRTIASALRAAHAADQSTPASLSSRFGTGASAAERLATATDLDTARSAFAEVSESLVALISADPQLAEQYHVFECSMTGGYNRWIQVGEGLQNPYQGPKMLTCGSELTWERAGPGAAEADYDPDEIAHYTCPMDTWVKKKDPGQCPVCGMDLVPVTKEEIRTGVMRIDHRRRQLIGLRTGLVERRPIDFKVRAIGRVAYDETRLADITLKVDGWIEKLRVNATGQPVKRGQTLFTLYSPVLYTAQQEFLLATRQVQAATSESARQRAEALLRGARQRLLLWDIAPAQLDRIATSGQPIQYLPIVSPASGFVVEKNVVEGAAVKAGEKLFRIAALDRVWVEADVYEQDIPFAKVGSPALVTLSHLPGRTFEGQVAFIYPYLDGQTRTARLRIELPNAELELKPDMYANVELSVDLGERLVIPESAVIYSGPRRIVFIDVDTEKLMPKAIEVGVKSDGFFEVLSGLEEGDRVVTSGNFLLSAESRLKAATGLW